MSVGFLDKLERAIEANDSLLCVGLDPDPGRIPEGFRPDAEPVERARDFCHAIVEATSDLVCCYKPNSAFFEQFGPEGLAALRDVIAAVPPEIPVLLDAKRGDIGNTAKAYARAAFDVLGADAITLSPYLGRDTVDPFLAYPDKVVFLLCHTSNPSAAEVQHHGVEPLFQRVARMGTRWDHADRVAFVVGATQPDALEEVRALAPRAWILAPGVGAQGGDLRAALRAGLRADGSGLIVPVSRGVLYADDPRAAAMELRARINAGRAGVTTRPARTQTSLVRTLFEAGCVKFGDFTLASGKRSPIYVDLRRVISYPNLLLKVTAAYAALARELSFDRIAAVPYAALPATAALALALDRPMIYPRKEAKGHGTRQAVEGDFEPGQTALVVEDVVTTGGSLLQAIETLEEAELDVRDVLVLVDREQGGAEALAEHGYTLHPVLTISAILDVLHAEELIAAGTYVKVREYLNG